EQRRGRRALHPSRSAEARARRSHSAVRSFTDRVCGASAPATKTARRAWGVVLLLALVVFACFLPALGSQFVLWDDDMNFTDNPSYRGLSVAHLRWMFTTLYGGHYQPLSWVTLGLDYTLWGMNPTGYHLTNILLPLLSKAGGITLPLVLLALDVYPLRRLVGRSDVVPRLREKIPYLALALGGAVLAQLASNQVPAKRTLAQHGVVERAAQAAYGLVFYLWKTVAPVRLSPVYLLEQTLRPSAPRYLASAAIVAGVTAAAVLLRRRAAWATVACACYALVLVPVLGFVQTGPQIAADR